ncbi:aldose 1-epimerase [Kocuria varians]|uniref:Aldose 1-epimerase n=1 Tax=Kocuria varians TaxID=1272 RepID=A0A4Y4D6U4_KOCVA|nr:hypothetical protein [Kocuria varians]GED00043.1 aldose 1-epimerase [Kocuria varians]
MGSDPGSTGTVDDDVVAVRTVSGPGGTAVVARRGAALASFHDPSGNHLVLPTEPNSDGSDCSGVVLAPWTNRIRDGRYTFHGTTRQLPLTEPERGAAAHGLALRRDWQWDVQACTAQRVVLHLDLLPEPGYPHALRLTCSYAVDEHGLTVTVAARNLGRDPAPYVVGGHPYLVPPTAPESTGRRAAADGWTLSVPADVYLRTDPERLLPLEILPVAGSREDFRGGRALREIAHDVALGSLARESDGTVRCSLTGEGGTTTVLTCGETVHWIQVYTDDNGMNGVTRRAVAVEPMSAPADAFNSGQGLVVLGPHEEHRVWWRIGSEGG